MHRDGIVVTESKDVDLVVIGSCGAPVAVAVGGGGTNQYDTGSGSGYVEYVDLNVNGSYRLVLCRFLKIRNCESQFYLPFSERRNCDSRNDSFSIHFTILLANDSGIDSRKKAKNSEGIGIAILLESEL